MLLLFELQTQRVHLGLSYVRLNSFKKYFSSFLNQGVLSWPITAESISAVVDSHQAVTAYTRAFAYHIHLYAYE